ncbi:hypothetical protein KKF84_18965 [Myxococcota bacterium]|nr:hypothetical protein [Myxococcota bacterium]MBU1537405.1 hypothetical protein [Myxococcota bacterium]
MASYENCPPQTDLVPVIKLESIFEMEQIVEILDQQMIPWKVIQADDILQKSFASNIGYSTLWVEKGQEKVALEIVKTHRENQARGHECESCGLSLGADVDQCPVCFPSLD